ncbi:MAG: transglutaminase-like putative cysteine protease [Candidatus Endobugula sp.]|jgi:transglutaminase-like putative cysteine protease
MSASDILLPRTLLFNLLAVYSGVCALHFSQLPVWMWLVSIVAVLWRVQLLRQKISSPSRLIRTLCVVTLTALLFFQYQQWFAVEPMVVLLVVALTLKLLEIRRRRDVLVIVYLYYFVIACGFLFKQSVLHSVASVLVLVFATMVLLHLHSDHLTIKKGLRLSITLLLQSTFLAAVMLLVLPRINPLWSVPLHSGQATTGVSDSMSPGDISNLIRNNALAFRVMTEKASLSREAMYWRGLVLDDFNGRRWQRSQTVSETVTLSKYKAVPAAVDESGSQLSSRQLIDYEILLEPTGQQWLYGIPSAIITKGIDTPIYSAQTEMFQKEAINQRIKYQVRSNSKKTRDIAGLSNKDYRQLTYLPPNSNLRSQRVAREWWQQAGSNKAYIQKVLSYYRNNFTYTLSPPKLGRDTVDKFLFETKEGFCEHYSSSFTVLMRAVGIPARVVVGYQGGEWDDSDQFLQVYQRDAHAWTEVWLDNKGWVRIDPTAAVAAIRIEQGVSAALPPEERGFVGRSHMTNYRWLLTMQQQWQVLDYRWQSWVLDYDTEKQQSMLSQYLGDLSFSKMIAVVVVPLVFAAFFICFGLFRHRIIRLTPEKKLYRKLQKKLTKLGVENNKGESIQGYCQRAVTQYPERSAALLVINSDFERLLYKPDMLAEQQQACFARIKRNINAL